MDKQYQLIDENSVSQSLVVKTRLAVNKVTFTFTDFVPVIPK